MVIIAYVILHLFAVLHDCAPYVHSIGETHVAVCLCLFVKHHDRHLLKNHHKGVVAYHLVVEFLYYLKEGQGVALEIGELLCSLMTGVSEIEDVVRLLRVEHQRILATLLHNIEQLVAHLLVLLLIKLRTSLLLVVLLGELRAQYGKSVT